MSTLASLALGSIAVINASFMGVVARELAGSDAVGVAVGAATLAVEVLIARQVRRAMSAPSLSSPHSSEGGRA